MYCKLACWLVAFGLMHHHVHIAIIAVLVYSSISKLAVGVMIIMVACLVRYRVKARRHK